MTASLALLVSRGALAATLNVDPGGAGDFVTIQEAIDAASNGDVVTLAAGVYDEALRLGARELELRGVGADEVLIGAKDASVAMTLRGGAAITLVDLSLTGSSSGVDQIGGALVLERVHLSGFSAGAATLVEATLEARDCELEDNRGRSGAALHLTATTAELVDTTLSSNEAETSGGAVYATDGSSLSLVRATLRENVAGANGGALALEGADLSAATTRFEGNESVGQGGAVWLSGGAVAVEGGAFVDNAASSGAGLYVEADATASVVDAELEGNAATERGGGAHADGELSLDGATVTGNSARRGGGLSATGGLDVAGTDFVDNVAETSGGAISVDGDSLYLRQSSFTGNTAPQGAAVHDDGGGAGGTWATIADLELSDNDAGDGATVYVASVSALAFRDVVLRDNVGDGLLLRDASPELSDVDAHGHEAGVTLEAVSDASAVRLRVGENGDGLVLRDVVGLRVANLVAASNTGSGVLVIGDNADLVIENADLVGNERGIWVSESAGVSTVNVNAVANTKAGFAAEPGTLAVRYGNAWGNDADWGQLGELTGTDGNLSVDPTYTSFVDDGVDDDLFGLAPGSACIDAGDPELADPDGGPSDLGAYGGPDADVSDEDGDGYAVSTGDCDDDDAGVYPGAPDTWYDGIDSDCAGDDDYDADGDGYATSEGGGDPADCDDNDPSVYPGADDLSGDGADTNCDGVDGYASGADEDRDGDGFTEDGGDCNDWDRQIHPDAPEACGSNIDNDCDGVLDRQEEACAIDAGCGGCGGGGGSLALVVLVGALTRRRG